MKNLLLFAAALLFSMPALAERMNDTINNSKNFHRSTGDLTKFMYNEITPKQRNMEPAHFVEYFEVDVNMELDSSMNAEQTREYVFAAMDSNRDNTISRAEFLEKTLPNDEIPAFIKMDADTDGYLNKDEFFSVQK